jgi:hypothetical protein
MVKNLVNNISDFSFSTPAHIRGARAWIGWKLEEMRTISGVDRDTISRFELNKQGLRNATLARLYLACFEAGVEILPDGLRVRETA